MKIKLLKSIFILLILVTSCSTEKTDVNQANKTKDVIIKTSSNSEAFIEVNFLEGSIARYWHPQYRQAHTDVRMKLEKEIGRKLYLSLIHI